MGYCRACKGEHKPFRKIDAAYLGANYYPNRFVTHPEVFPSFVNWLREWIPDVVKDRSDEEVLDWFKRGRGAQTDLLHGYTEPGHGVLFQPATKFLVLRDMQMPCTGELFTTVCGEDDLASTITTNDVSEDGTVAATSWIVSHATAAGLREILREKIGEPDSESLTDADTIQRIHDGPGQDIVHMERGCDCGTD